jgi:hypothetical protein
VAVAVQVGATPDSSLQRSSHQSLDVRKRLEGARRGARIAAPPATWSLPRSRR